MLLKTHSDVYIKGDKYFLFKKGDKYLFFMKVYAANILLSSVDAIQKDHIYQTKQYQTFYRKIKCDLLNFGGEQNRYHQYFQYFFISIHFFHEVTTLI